MKLQIRQKLQNMSWIYRAFFMFSAILAVDMAGLALQQKTSLDMAIALIDLLGALGLCLLAFYTKKFCQSFEDHRWQREYMGSRCTKCGEFIPEDVEPWLPDEEQEKE